MIFKQIWHAIKTLADNNLTVVAGYISFTTFFALFPFMLFLGSLASFLGTPETLNNAIDLAFRYFPEEVADDIVPVIHAVLNNDGSTQLLTFSIIGTLWASSSGLEGLRAGLNTVYQVEKVRPLWHRRLHSMGLVVITAFVFITASFILLFTPLLLKAIAPYFPFVTTLAQPVLLVSYGLAFVVITAIITALHRFLPNCPPRRLFQYLPGAALSALAWLVMAAGFSTYLKYFDHYDTVYGSIGGVIIGLLFFYLSAILVLFGAAFNQVYFAKGQSTQ